MSGAYIPLELQRQVRADAGPRCGYCRSSEALTGIPLEFEHLVPETLGGETRRENLWLACHRCNQFKGPLTQALDPFTGENTPLFNPRTQRWAEHFVWSPDSLQILGLTASGRATVVALRLNNPYAIQARQFWVQAGWHPPEE